MNLKSERSRNCVWSILGTFSKGYRSTCTVIIYIQNKRVYISQLIRYSRACGSYQYFIDRELMLARKLLNQGFLFVKLKSTLTVATMTRLTVMEYICITNDHGYVPFVVSTSRSFAHSWLITGSVTRITQRVPLVEQEIFTYLEYPSSPPVFSGVRVARSLVLCVWFVDRCLSFCPFFLAIVLSVLRFMDSDYPFGIFKLFLTLLKSILSILYGIKGHLKLWVCLTLQCTVLWMIRGRVSQIDPKKELKCWTTSIIVLLKEQSTVYIHGKLLRPSQ
jgi:hypothetical protein